VTLRSVLLSVKPRYANALLDGTKTAEIRRRFPDLPLGTVVFVYASSPERRLIGTFAIRGIRRLPADRLWAAYPGQLALTRQEVRDYLRGRREGVAIETADVVRWRRPVTLAEFRLHSGIDVPQSWRYINEAQLRGVRIGPTPTIATGVRAVATEERIELQSAS
jgi:predicted transcriptional regulator